MKKNKEIRTNKLLDRKMTIFYINISLFIIITILVLTKIINPLDDIVESFVIGIRNNNLTKMMINITNIGSAYSLIAVTTLLFFLIRDKRLYFSK